MKRTVKVKLSLEDKEAMDKTVEQFKKACQMVVEEGWDEDGLKTYQKYKLQKRAYHPVKDETGLQANLVIRAISRASEAIKGCVERLKQGKKASKPRFTSDSIAYDKRTLTVKLDERRCTISTLEGRIDGNFVLPDDDNDYYDKYLNNGWTVTQSTIEKHDYEDGEPYYLHLGLEKEDEEIKPLNPTVMGVDLGIDNLAVTSTGRFYSGQELKCERQRYEEIRGKLQDKGTRSAHLTIQQMSGRENRYACDTLHRISKSIVEEAEEHNVDVIVFENLKNIREDMPRSKQFHSWAFKQLYDYVKYKAKEKGITVEQTSPKYTSQRCSKCGYTDRRNRNNGSFKCEKCGYELQADYNASKNIGIKFLRAGQMSPARMGHGQLALKSGVLKPSGNYIPS